MDDVVNDGLRIRLRDGRDIADLLALFNEERFCATRRRAGLSLRPPSWRRGCRRSVAPNATRRSPFWPAGRSASPGFT